MKMYLVLGCEVRAVDVIKATEKFVIFSELAVTNMQLATVEAIPQSAS